MPELQTYLKHEIPRELAAQISSYVRIQWPFLLGQSPLIWDYSPRADAPVHFLLVHGEALVSHCSVNHRPVKIGDETLNVYGLSAVFTYPAFRKGGHAHQVVKAATQHIASQPGADVAMLFAGEHLRAFYSEAGWTPMDTAQILYGDPANPTLKNDNLVMMLFPSAAGARAQSILETQHVFVGKSTW